METESRYLLHLLGAYLRKEEPEVWPEVNWDDLMELAYMHNLSGILGYLADSYPICPETEKVAQLRHAYLSTLMKFANRGVLAEEFSRMLAQNGIDHVMMKGFVLRDFFPVPELRTYGDIDLVIRPEDRQRSHTLMKEQGFQVKTDWEPVYSYIRDSEFYEIHTELLETDVSRKVDCRAYFSGLWDHVIPVGDHRYQFAPEYHFLYMIAHIAKHVAGSGAGIRMYLDVAAYILHYGENLDWEETARELENLGLRDFANAVFTMVQKDLGIRSPIALTPVDEDVLADFMELTMKGGIFGRKGQDSGTVSVREESRQNGDISPTRTLMKRLFPSAKTIQSRYTYLQNKPWLLPAAWVHRFVKTRSSWKEHTEQAQKILSADKEEVRRLNKMYQELGL